MKNKIFIIFILLFLHILSIMFLIINEDYTYYANFYKSIPLIFIIVFLLTDISSIYLILRSGRNIILYYIVIISNIIFVNLPIFLKMYFWLGNGDPASHVGIINEINNTKTLNDNIVYPLIHIKTLNLIYVTNISTIINMNIVIIVFSIIYFIFISLIMRKIFKTKYMIFSIFLFVPIHIWFTNFTANHMANLFFPIVVFLFILSYNDKSKNNLILFSIILMIYSIFHPNPTIIVLIFLVTAYFISKDRRYLFLFTMVAIIFILWISKIYVWNLTINQLYQSMLGNTENNITQVSNRINYATGKNIDIVAYFIKIYLLKLFLAILFLYVLIKQLIIKRNRNRLVLVFFVFNIIIYSLILILYFINAGSDPLRLLIYPTIISSILIVTFFKKIILNKNKIIIFSIILILFTFSYSSLFPSPYIYKINYYTPQKEFNMMDYYLSHKADNYYISTISIQPQRFEDFFINDTNHIEDSELYDKIIPVPLHFNYNVSNTINTNITENTYLILCQRDEMIYRDLYPELSKIRFTENDFILLSSDISINKIYTNQYGYIYITESV